MDARFPRRSTPAQTRCRIGSRTSRGRYSPDRDRSPNLAATVAAIGAFLHLWRRAPETVHDRAVRLLQVADDHDLQIWKALGRCLLGAANMGIGTPEVGLAQIREGLELYRGLKTPPVFWPLLL